MPSPRDSSSDDVYWNQVPDITLEYEEQYIPAQDASTSVNFNSSQQSPQKKWERTPERHKIMTQTPQHRLSQMAGEQAEQTPSSSSRSGQGYTPLRKEFGQLGLTSGPPASPTRQNSSPHGKVIIIDSDDEYDTDTSSESSDLLLDDPRNFWSRQTSMTSMESGGSPSRKRSQDTLEVDRSGSPKMRKTSNKGKAPVPPSPGTQAHRRPSLLTETHVLMTSPTDDSQYGPGRHFTRTTSNESTASTEFRCRPSSTPSSNRRQATASGASPIDVDLESSNHSRSSNFGSASRNFTRTTSTESSSSTGSFLDGYSSSASAPRHTPATVFGSTTSSTATAGSVRRITNTDAIDVDMAGPSDSVGPSRSGYHSTSAPRSFSRTASRDDPSMTARSRTVPSTPASASSSTSRFPVAASTKPRQPPPPRPVFELATPASVSKAGSSVPFSSASAAVPTTCSNKSFVQQTFEKNCLPRQIIAHDDKAQALFDDPKKPVPWGTQLMLAAGVTRNEWSWARVISKMEHFQGKKDSEVMHKVNAIMVNDPSPFWDETTHNIANEYEREQKAIEENKGRGLGVMGSFEGEENWYGGQIQQIAKLVKKSETNDSSSDEDEFRLVLEPLEMRRSSRFTRLLGSRRVLQIRINSDFMLSNGGGYKKKGEESDREKVMKFLSHAFVLNGRLFLVTPPKDDGVYAIEVNEDYGRPNRLFGDQFRISLADFMEHHNPFELNSSQPTSKFFARWALAMSTSIPVIEFRKDAIQFIDDIVVDGVIGKPESYQILTDGCGLINKAALIAIKHQMNYNDVPTAIQARVAGSKGLFILHPDNEDTEPRIWIRDSQRKIKYPEQTEHIGKYLWQARAHRILDLVHVSHASSTSSVVYLSRQSILNMSHNKVPDKIFCDLMEQGLRETLRPLLEWEGKWAMAQLWDAINRTGRVASARLARLAPSVSRAFGFSGREWARGDAGGADEGTSISASGSQLSDGSSDEEEEKEKKAVGLLNMINARYTGRDAISGAPASLYEYSLEKVQAGFNPIYDEDLNKKVWWMMKDTIKSYIEKCRIPLPDGTAVEAFVAPDPLGVLKEGEIYYKPSLPINDSVTQERIYVLEGDVLIGRYPIRLPSDIQKVTAVNIPALERWTDVVLVPIVPVTDVARFGEVSFMNMLSGGDMDGDTVFITWYKDIVEPFRKTSLILPPMNLDDDFERQVERGSEFRDRLEALPTTEERQVAFQRAYLSGMAHFNVGLYSVFHDTAVWCMGYDHSSAIRLAYKFNYVLDGPKTGRQLREEIFIQDNQIYKTNRPDPKWKPKDRLARNPSFILDILAKAAEDLGAQYIREFEMANGMLIGYGHKRTTGPDVDLKQPWQKLLDLVASKPPQNPIRITLQVELDRVQKHVEESHSAYVFGAASSSSSSSNADRQPNKYGRKAPRKDCMAEAKQKFAEPIADIELLSTLGDLEKIKASCAYHIKDKFGFCVAFQQLCAIKAEASSGGGAPSIRLLDEVKSLPSASRRLFERA